MTRTATLDGLKVVEFDHVIAGPFCASLLADLGATVVHVEDPGGGDALRTAGPARDGHHLWWKVAGRNKHSVTLNLRTDEGRALAQRLATWADVVITNFRVSTLERWGLDFATLNAVNRKLIYLQITGFGATSSRRDDPGFGKVGEAMSGVVHLTGQPDGPPLHTGFSHGDATTGLMGAFAIQAALYRRQIDPAFSGEWIDLALYDSLFRMIEWQVIVRDQLGVTPVRSGNRLSAAPAAVINVYQTSDARWLTVTSGTVRSVSNVAKLLGEPEEDYRTRAQQEERAPRLDELLHAWIAARTLDECLEAMRGCDVVASSVYDADDILADPVFRERESIVEVQDPDLGPVRMQGVVPRMTMHPGGPVRPAPALGASNRLVYGELLGLSPKEIEVLQDGGHV